MHGRKKVTQTETEQRVLREKGAAYSAVATAVLDKKQKNEYSVESLTMTEKLLKSNPDFYSLWNFRRNILIHLHTDVFGVFESKESIPFLSRAPLTDGNAAKTLVQKELDMAADGIRKNPKSYGAWYHRQWIFDRFQVDLESELALCALLLKQDQRNFHCWNYRRYIVQQSSSVLSSHGSLTKTEFDFSKEKITENFSNYSAFHHRSVYLKQLFQPETSIHHLQDAASSSSLLSAEGTAGLESRRQQYEETLVQEFSLVENAIFTEPDDQSAWWYHQFLLAWMRETARSSGPAYTSIYTGTLRSQLPVVENLLSLEPDNKWALVCMVNLYQHLLAAGRTSTGNAEVESDVQEWQVEKERVLTRLIEIDPAHKRRYEYLLSPSS